MNDGFIFFIVLGGAGITMDTNSLEKIAKDLVAPGKGVLAADESNGTMSKRLEAVGIEPSEENRRKYRVNLFSSENYEKAISGVILYDETIRQKMDDGTHITQSMINRGIYPGIKVDTGTIDFEGHEGERITEGLDGLKERCQEYFEMGARFAKWRAVIFIDNEKPSDSCINENAQSLAKYARICQECGLVPIIEPEVLMDGTHSAERCLEVTSKVLATTFAECEKNEVYLPGVLLKPNMIISGNMNDDKISRKQVAEMTVKCLSENVPSEVPGIVFLSGGQSDEDATAHLNIMNRMDKKHPWELSYSYGRALQASALKQWARGSPESSQLEFLKRAEMNHKARYGEWDVELEN
jgi:fructose-bisphosphate aldolase class I